MKKLNKKGFTLVELLAVIVVLALLMVVATRTVGNSLTNSKKKAMQTELNKIVSKTYEEVNAAILLHSTLSVDDFSYDIGGSYTAASRVLTGKEGNYSYKIEHSATTSSPITITKACITDGTNGYDTNAASSAASISGGNSVVFSSDTWIPLTAISSCSW